MSDIANGIEEGASAPDADLNTQAGFDAALARQAGQELPEDYSSSEGFSIAGGLETIEEPAEQPRNPDGTFAPKATPEAEQTTPPTDAEEPAAPVVEPQVDWEARYNELQSAYGRQGNELGELRQNLARIEGRLDERQSQPEPYPVVNDQVLEQIEDDIARRGGASVVNDIIDRHPNLIDQTVRLWLESGDPAAHEYNARYQAFKVMQEYSQEQPATPAQPQVDPVLEQVRQREMASAAVNAVLAHVPEAQRAEMRAHIGTTLEELPEDVAAGLFDPGKQPVYSKFVADLAQSKYVAAATASAQGEQQQGAEAAKAAARVASGSLQPAGAPEGESAQLSKEERTAMFHKALLETPTASISEGLTYGK